MIRASIRCANIELAGGQHVLELVQAGGWLMLPIILCSIIAIAIIIERFWTLNVARISPAEYIGSGLDLA